MSSMTDNYLMIDSYLTKVRTALGSLPEPEIEDILRELRSHAQELAATQGMDAALRSLGDPVDLAKTYRAGNAKARTACGNTPLMILERLRAAARSQTQRVTVTALYVFGYAYVVFLWVAALEKLGAAPRTGWPSVAANLAAGVLLKYLVDMLARWWIQRHPLPALKA
jgi:uncharacterized membrane protein